jgi:predicted lipoprotein with Yx(FWY)xxD motif
MKRSLILVIPAVLFVGGGTGVGIAAAASHRTIAHAAQAATLSTRATSYGRILVNGKGDTVYLWAKDKRGAKTSACNKACQAVWPLVTVSGKASAGSGVNKSLLGTIKVEGKTEVTYNGWPLYTFKSDARPGQMKGEGNKTFGGAWWVVSPSGKAITSRPESTPIY